MNPIQIYNDAVNKPLKGESIAAELEATKADQTNLAEWEAWRKLPQTKYFQLIIEARQDALMHTAMQSPTNSLTPLLLNEANTLDKIINSVMQNGKYENPT